MEGLPSKPLVVIIGLDGFVGSHVAWAFTTNGQFRVRGTVKSLQDDLAPIKLVLGEHFENIELIETDILSEKSIFDCAEGCQYIIHTVAPFFRKDKRPEK